MYVVISWRPRSASTAQAVRSCIDAVLQFPRTGATPDFDSIYHPFDGCTVAAVRRPSQGAVVALADRLHLCTLAESEPDFSFVLAYSETGYYLAGSADVSQASLDRVTEHP